MLDGIVDKSIFGNYGDRVCSNQHLKDSALSGYEDVAGLINLKALFPSLVETLKITQEFGTFPGFIVLKSLIDENAAFMKDPDNRMKYGNRLRDVFYLKDSNNWKLEVVTRGVTVFNQVETWLSIPETVNNEIYKN
jgi:hypothetical protein